MNTAETAALLRGWDHILILTHKRPDGDTVGCAAALCAALRRLGKTAYVLPNADVIPLLAPYLAPYLAPEGFTPDRVVAVDIASQGLFTQAEECYKGKVDLCVDHHLSNELYARETCLEADKAACGEIVFAIVRELLGDTPLPAEIALPLYVAVSTDTGCFVYPSTTANTHAVAAALMATGIDYAGVNKRHFLTKSFKRLKLESMLTAGMELYDGGETAVAAVTLEMLDSLQATEEDTDNISAFAGQTEGVKNAVTLREYLGGEFRVSLRTGGDLNASQVCALLGGGGHVCAAGCTVKGTAEEAKRAILGAIRAVKNE